MSIKLRRQKECEQVRTATEKLEALSDVFVWHILRQNCLMFEYSMIKSSQWNYCSANTNAASQNLAKKLQRRIFNHKNRIVVANSQVVDRSQNYRIYNVIGLLSSLWNVYHSTAAYFFDPPRIAYDEQQQPVSYTHLTLPTTPYV